MKPPCDKCQWKFGVACVHKDAFYRLANVERSYRGNCSVEGRNFEPKQGQKSVVDKQSKPE